MRGKTIGHYTFGALRQAIRKITGWRRDKNEIQTSEGVARVGIGRDPVYPLDVYADASSWVGRLQNDGNNTNRYGVKIQCGTDNASGTNYPLWVYDGDGTSVGGLSFSGATVTYSAFTGDHHATIDEGVSEYPYGTLMKIQTTTSNGDHKQASYECTQTTTANDPAVFGAYSAPMVGAPEGVQEGLHSIFALGDGHVLVCNEGGDISVGDYICSSNTAGHGQKQADNLMRNYTVAKATESVTWSEEEITKLISCTYHSA